MDRRLDDFEVLLGRPEDQIEIPEWIEIAEIAAFPREHLIVLAQQNLGTAQRVGEPGVDEIAEQIREKPVGDQIERTHRLLFHRVNQPGAVDEFRLPGLDHGVILR